MTTSGDTPEGPGTRGSTGDDAHRRAVSSLPRLTGDEVRNRGFKRATRGVSEAEVRNFLHRVAGELEAGRERERELEDRIRLLEEELRSPPPVTEEQLLDALGAETARVLRTAQHAAREIRDKAESSSGALVADSEKTARELRSDAEAFVAERRREGEDLASSLRTEAEAHAQQLREEAQQQASEIRERAIAEAEAGIAEALDRGRAMVAEAKSVRARVLTDLAHRRKSLRSQLDELRAGRERLLDGYRVVRRTLGEAAEALGSAPPAESDLDLEALTSEEPEATDAHLDAVLAESEVAATATPVAEVEPDTVVGEDVGASGKRPIAGAVEEVVPDEEAVPPGRGLRAYVKGALGIGGDEADVDDAEGGEAVPAPASRSDPHEVFARLRAATDEGSDSVASKDDGEPAPAEAGAIDGAAAAHEPSGGAGAAPPFDADAQLVRARDEAIAGTEEELARAAKRAAQDVQNELLDAIRRAKRRKDLSPLLPDRDDVVTDWVAVIREPLGVAYGAEPPGELVSELATRLVGSLHDRFAAALAEGGDSEALNQRISARSREWRSQELAGAVAEVVATAHSRAVFDATKPSTPLRWVPARPGRCPDCDDNALEPTPRGDMFPTGVAFPPAHPGCRCLLVADDT